MNTKKITTPFIIALTILHHPQTLYAQNNTFFLKDKFPAAANLPNPGDENILSDFINPIVSFVPIITSLLAFIIIIIAGIKYISSAGNAQETKKAGSMITYALVGLVLSALAFWITRLLFTVGTGDNQTLF